jgi:CRISPR-associated protein Cas1
VIAKIDLVEGSGGVVIPVDYKHGRPKQTDAGLEAWPADRVQLAAQGLLLRENGYTCDEGVAYYAQTKQRVRVTFDESVMRETEKAIGQAWALAHSGELPPPLVDSPKCPGCSLVGICLPDETNSLRDSGLLSLTPSLENVVQLTLFPNATAGSGVPANPPLLSEGNRDLNSVRQLIAPRDDLRPLYLNAQGIMVGKSGDVLQVREKGSLKQEIRIGEICQVNLMGNVQVSTQAIHSLCGAGKPVCYFSQGGWFYGITS